MSKCKMPGESIECKPTQPELVDNANFLGDTFMDVVLWLVTNEINNKSFCFSCPTFDQYDKISYFLHVT